MPDDREASEMYGVNQILGSVFSEVKKAPEFLFTQFKGVSSSPEITLCSLRN